MQPLQILQQISGRLDQLDQPEAVHRAMDEVEFVFELLPPEMQDLADQLLKRLRRRLQELESG
jgi:hypothetical protein